MGSKECKPRTEIEQAPYRKCGTDDKKGLTLYAPVFEKQENAENERNDGCGYMGIQEQPKGDLIDEILVAELYRNEVLHVIILLQLLPGVHFRTFLRLEPYL
ncbi:MAG TPA: hypothetical protein VFT82_02650 [Candidatus Paceibacterota bacterium]|nr:hypothetical protein [Candidatus Paceibacterota bacterium]